MSYWNFIRRDHRFLAFGFVMVFVGNYGQTFFISVFGGHLREAFSLSHTGYSGYYSLATLLSGFGLLLFGGKLDTSRLQTFTLWVLCGSLIAALVMAFAFHPWLLFLGFLLLRFCGQGLSTHVAFTTMARFFDKNRGKATSIAAMGMPLGEFVLPLIAALLIQLFGWRVTWALLGLSIPLFFLPILLWSMGDARIEHPLAKPDHSPGTEQESRHWQRNDVIKDPRFWIAIPAVLSPAVLITGVFFHQAYWAEARLWSLGAVAASMALYAMTHALGSLFTGALVDRWGAKRVLKVYLLPLLFAILSLQGEGFVGWLMFMGLAGISIGASGPTVGSLWPEVYGTRYLGSIRSLVSALMVVSTAISPLVIGLMIDQGIKVDTIMAGLAGYIALACLICQRVYRAAR